jgi:hypothetical protein
MADRTLPSRGAQPPGLEAQPPSDRDIATAAYFIAERRGFEGDQQLDDWLEAEQALGVRPEDGAPRNELAAREHVVEDIKPDEIHLWADKLQVSPEELRTAIQRVGPSSIMVKQFFESDDMSRSTANKQATR